VPIDIFIYAIIAAGLVFWLRSILGTRHGDERERPNPYSVDIIITRDEEPEDGKGMKLPHNAHERISELHENPKGALSINNKTAEAGLLAIADADKNFDIKVFLDASQDAFVMIVEAFAAGDRDLLKDLLSKDVFKAFDGAIKEREKRGEMQETEILSVQESSVLEAALSRKKARITVRFVAEEISTTKDKDGEVIAGHAEKIIKMVDIWTFERSISSSDPSWLLVETRSDDPEDNDLIPDTD